MGKNCEIIVGSYEEFVLGFYYLKKDKNINQTFAVHSHAGSIRCVAQCRHLLASGGSDDRIVIYNLKTRKEHCLLNHHNGTVNCLQFTNDHTHLISGGQDGMLAIIRIGNWQLEKVWEKAHKGAAILDIALHPSGKLALTLGADATIHTWNLVKGRQAYIINLNNKVKEPQSMHRIIWGTDDIQFALISNTCTDIWSIETGGVLKSMEHKQKISSCIWYSANKIIVGYEDGHIGIVDNDSGEIELLQAHSTRVKCLALFNNKLVTASSSGEIKVWSNKFTQLCSTNAGCRLTCICIYNTDNETLNDTTDETVGDALREEETITPKQKKAIC